MLARPTETFSEVLSPSGFSLNVQVLLASDSTVSSRLMALVGLPNPGMEPLSSDGIFSFFHRLPPSPASACEREDKTNANPLWIWRVRKTARQREVQYLLAVDRCRHLGSVCEIRMFGVYIGQLDRNQIMNLRRSKQKS